ncbi:unnamed protein product [Ectocarpus sp. 6 AP-2014]
MGGAASETPVTLSAAGSFLVFFCYFSYVLFSVPRHGEVPYTNRLNRHITTSRCGLFIEILNALFSLATCVLFVLETYSFGNNYGFIVISFSMEMVFNGFFLFNFLLHLYLAVDKLTHLVSLQAVVDIVTVFPSYLILFMNDGWRTSEGGFADAYLGLKITRVIRVARLLVTISFFVQGPSLAFDHSRQLLVLRSQLVRWSLKTVLVIFTMAGLTNFLVVVQDADWGLGYGKMPFHEALYFIVVSFSTVGYGDISPSTALSRVVITGLILTLFFCVPLVTNALVNLTKLTPKHGGCLSKSWGTGHIVVGCDASCLRVVSVLLRDLLAADSVAYHHEHVVLVIPQEPTLAWDALLCLQPSFAVTYLNGDLSSAKDLRRARVANARACFVLSDRLANDTEAQDKTALLRALSTNQASPPGSSVLCLVTHSRSKGRLVRLGMPEASVVCYDEVMEGLVTQACLNPGFSTVWTNMLSCMPEADYLLKTRGAEQDVTRDPESTALFETETEYLRSLRRVTLRFRLTCFAGECTGDAAIELHEKCGCILFALICNVCSGGHKSRVKCGAGKRRRRCVRVHPDYGTIISKDDVGVFISANHESADLLARYCTGRATSGAAATAAPSKASGRSLRREGWVENAFLVAENPPVGKRQHGTQENRQRNASSGDGRFERTIWSDVHDAGGGASTPSVFPLGESLVGPPPGTVLVIAQSLSFALGVVLSLCEAGDDLDVEGSPALSVVCSPTWWDPVADERAERELAARFPCVRLVKRETECECLLEVGADKADLVCVVSSRPEDEPTTPKTGGGGGDGDVLGDHSGRGQGSDVWAMGVVVDVLGLVPESTRVVVRFDDSASAEQHQVISAHVRRREDARETGRRERAAAESGEKQGEENLFDGRKEQTDKAQQQRDAPRNGNVGTTVEDSVDFGYSARSGVGGGGVYFDDTRGVVREGFDDFFGTMSGYVSGDVVVGNAAELLLLQTMLAPDIQSLMSDVMHLVSRVPIEVLWPEHSPNARGTAVGENNDNRGDGDIRRSRIRPVTYGEAFRLLLEDRDLLALGLHRPPTHGRGPRKMGGRERWRCPGGSRYVAINSPSASFALRDGDCFFVLRRRSRLVSAFNSEPAVDPQVTGTCVSSGVRATAALAATAADPTEGTATPGKDTPERLHG